MSVPEHVHRFWRALDERIGLVEPAWWGAVVTAPAFPAIWDANYARIDVAAPDLRAAEIADVLIPALERVGTDVFHVVSFQPEETTGVLTELSSLGHRLTWDVVLDLAGRTSIDPRLVPVRELDPDAALWDRVEESMSLFGISREIAPQLRGLEEATQGATAKRWFGVDDGAGQVMSMAALVLLGGVGYLDNVVTFPEARGRGLATAIAGRVVDEARASGAEHVCLLADPDDRPVIRMYERLGFRPAGRLASTRGSVASVRS